MRIADRSWIQPGKAVWDWRIRNPRHGDFLYGADTSNYTRLIDFAAQNNIPHLLIDANWYGPESDSGSDPLTPDPRIDLGTVLAHARENRVGVLLYVNDRVFDNRSVDEVFAAFHARGVAGVKYGFMRGAAAQKVRKTIVAIESAAKHQTLINFHDNPIHPPGLQRTYPNLISVESDHAQADGLRTFTPGEYLRTVFVHTLAGPLEMGNGFFALESFDRRTIAGTNHTQRYPPIFATVVGETARILITDTGLSVLPDGPEEYLRKDNLFEFIRQLPNDR